MDHKRKNEDIFSKRVRAGRRRTYFIDVRTTRSNDYYVTITESKKKFDEDGYERHKIHLYKEDFNKFVAALNETVDHVKEELMPGYDFDQFKNDDDWQPDSKHNSSHEKKLTDTLDTTEPADTIEDASIETITNDSAADTSSPDSGPDVSGTSENLDSSSDGEAETWD